MLHICLYDGDFEHGLSELCTNCCFSGQFSSLRASASCLQRCPGKPVEIAEVVCYKLIATVSSVTYISMPLIRHLRCSVFSLFMRGPCVHDHIRKVCEHNILWEFHQSYIIHTVRDKDELNRFCDQEVEVATRPNRLKITCLAWISVVKAQWLTICLKTV